MTLKVVSESRVTWATSVPILVFLGLSVLELFPIYATDRRQTDRQTSDVRQKHSLIPPPIRGAGVINNKHRHIPKVTRLYSYLFTPTHTLKAKLKSCALHSL